MSFKCFTLCALVLLVGIEHTWAEGSKTLQPRPAQQIRDSKDLRFEDDEKYSSDDEDGDDIIDILYDENGNEVDVEKLDSAGIAKLNKLLDEMEDLERFESRAAGGNRGGKPSRRRNRNGSNKCGNRRLNRRGGNKRNNRINRNNRNGKRRRNGASRVARL